jgi:endonuclease/exonuclease/phosphatase family metal-dependent hydrolase
MPMSVTCLKILTYNIHKGFNASNRRFVLHQIRDALMSTHADLLLLQETQGVHQQHAQKIANWPVLSQFEFIAEDIWPFHVYGKNVSHKMGHHGNAILSKYPFKCWENINVSPYPWASRSLLHGVIHLPSINQELHLVCLHFGLTGRERIRQAISLCERIDSHVPYDAPLIVAGDFNDWREKIERHFHERLGLQEVFQETQGHFARTFPAWLPVLPMDRIYYRGLTPVSCECLVHHPWRSLSDHVPLAARFEL